MDNVIFEKYDAIFNQSPIAIEFYDNNGILVDANLACLNLFGVVDLNDIKNFSLFDDPNISDEYKNDLREGKHVRYQSFFNFDYVKELNLYKTTKSGKIFIDVIINQIKNDNNEPNGFLLQIQDITESEKIKDELELSKEIYVALSEASFESIFFSDEGICIEQNQTAERVFGYTHDEAIGRYGTDWIVIEDRDLVMKNMLSGYEKSYEATALRKDGTTFPCVLKGKMMKYKGKDIRVTSLNDISKHKKYENELKNSIDFAENLMNTANVMIVGLDVDGKVILFNNSAEKLTGYNKNEVIGKNWFNELPILSKQDSQRLNEVFKNLMGDDEHFNVVENSIITKDGEIRYILWQNNEIKEYGNVTGSISFGLDISDRLKFEHDLIEAKNNAEKSDRLKLEFLANMSHDLRTPMNAIIGFSDLLKSNNISKSDRNDYINTIINNGKFLMALIDDIIDISKIDAGNLKIENNDFELNKLLEELRLSYSKQTKDKNIDIIIEEDINKNIIINSDKYRLRQILMNLIGNAIKFTNDGYIKFGYKILNNRQLEIYVEDTGRGIERQYQRIIFERFKQIGTNNKFKGAGLGLSITKSLVELLGFKEIKLISELEKGSKFYFTIPYTIKHYNYINEIKDVKKHKKLNFHGKTILIIEDNDDSRLIMKSYLTPTNVSIIELIEGNNIMEVIKNNDIDLILLDIGLPGKNGYELLQEIRKYDNRLPVIVESALVMPDQKTMAFEMGCDDFISKPFNREDFLNKIDNLI